MSKLFHEVYEPLTYNNWKEWFIKFAPKDVAYDIFLNIKLLEIVTSDLLQELPQDVWNLIVTKAIKYELRYSKISQDKGAIRWIETWLKDKRLQLYNPMKVYKGIHKLINLLQPEAENTDFLQGVTIFNGKYKDSTLLNDTKIITVPHFGDYILGISIPQNDISDIIECFICINETQIKTPFIFNPKYINQLKGYEDEPNKNICLEYYFNPEMFIIPMCCLGYSTVTISFRLKDVYARPEVKLIYGFFGTNISYNLSRHRHTFVYQHNILIMESGYCGYF